MANESIALPSIGETRSQIINSKLKLKEKPSTSLTKAQKIERTEEICELYAEGIYTLTSCCEAVGVPERTFLTWVQPGVTQDDIESGNVNRGFVAESAAIYRECLGRHETNYFSVLKKVTRTSLLKVANGFEVQEKSSKVRVDKDGNQLPVEVSTTTKVFAPNVQALMFIAKNVDSENFSDKTETRISGGLMVANPFHDLNHDQLQEKREQLRQLLESGKEY